MKSIKSSTLYLSAPQLFSKRILFRLCMAILVAAASGLLDMIFAVATLVIVKLSLLAKLDDDTIQYSKILPFFHSLSPNHLALAYIVFIIIYATIKILAVKTYASVAANSGSEVASLVYKKSITRFDPAEEIGDSVVMLTSYIDTLVDSIYSTLVVISSLFTILSIIAAFSVLDPASTTAALFFTGILYIVLGSITNKRLSANGKQINRNSILEAQFATDSFNLNREIVIYGLERPFTKKYSEILRKKRSYYADSYVVGNSVKPILESAVFTWIILSLTIFTSTSSEDQLITTGGFFIIALQKILPSFQQVYASSAFIRTNIPKLHELLKKALSATDVKKATACTVITEASNHHSALIVLEDISYSIDSTTILNSFSADIKHGERIAICGSSGSGKSTLLDIILGFKNPSSGQITFNPDDNLSNYVSNSRDLISYMPQQVSVMNDTISSNILLDWDSQSLSDHESEAIYQSLKDAGIHLGTNRLDNPNITLDTIATHLSGGQQQRIALARTLFRMRPIVCLDEPTSALDQAISTHTIRNLFANYPTTTFIVITHDTKILKFFDSVLLVDNGKVTKKSMLDYQKINAL